MSYRISTRSLELLGQLARDARTHGLVIIVGSGVNGDAVPQWNALLSELFGQAIEKAALEDRRVGPLSQKVSAWCEREFDALAQASIIKLLLGPDRYRLELQRAIYRNIETMDDLNGYCRSPSRGKVLRGRYELLRSVAELCQLDEVKAVATFNFDTLLEQAITSCPVKRPGRKKTPRSYFGRVWSWAGLQGGREALPVYHVHGLLPPPASLLPYPKGEVVLSYDEYFDRNADPLSWETSSLIHFLRHYCVLWIGVSLKDWNMLRLLDAARRDHSHLRSYCLQSLPSIRTARKCRECKPCKECNPPKRRSEGLLCEKCCITSEIECEDLQAIAMRFRAELLSSVGVQLIVGGSNYADIPRTVQLLRAIIAPKTGKFRKER